MGAKEQKIDSHELHSGHIRLTFKDICFVYTSTKEHRGNAWAAPVLAVLRLSILEVVLHAPPEQV